MLPGFNTKRKKILFNRTLPVQNIHSKFRSETRFKLKSNAQAKRRIKINATARARNNNICNSILSGSDFITPVTFVWCSQVLAKKFCFVTKST